MIRLVLPALLLLAACETPPPPQRADPRLIQAQINVRNRYYAEIDIRYTGTSYAITYRDSQELGYKNGKIHRNYNRWVSMLDRDIMAALRSNGAAQAGTAAQLFKETGTSKQN